MKDKAFVEEALAHISLMEAYAPPADHRYANEDTRVMYQMLAKLNNLCEDYVAQEAKPATQEEIEKFCAMEEKPRDEERATAYKTLYSAPQESEKTPAEMLRERRLNFPVGTEPVERVVRQKPIQDERIMDAWREMNDLEEATSADHVVRGIDVHAMIEDEMASQDKKQTTGKLNVQRIKKQFAHAFPLLDWASAYGATKYDNPDGLNYLTDGYEAAPRYNAAGSRHDFDFLSGELFAPDAHVHHLISKAWNAMAELELATMDPDFRPIDPAWEFDYMEDWLAQAENIKLGRPALYHRTPEPDVPIGTGCGGNCDECGCKGTEESC